MYYEKKCFENLFKVIQNVSQKYGNFFQKTIGLSKITCIIAFQTSICTTYALSTTQIRCKTPRLIPFFTKCNFIPSCFFIVN
jgi:ABC-type maltose transport system permease subunit